MFLKQKYSNIFQNIRQINNLKNMNKINVNLKTKYYYSSQYLIKNKKFISLSDYDAIGFDCDHTVAQYHLYHLFKDTYEAMANFLAQFKGFHRDIFTFDPSFCSRGIILDLEKGDFLKLSHNGKILRAFHGTKQLNRNEINEKFGANFVWQHYIALSNSMTNIGRRYRIFENFFDMPTSLICAQIIDYWDKIYENKPPSYDVWPHVIEALHFVYIPNPYQAQKGMFFEKWINQTERYVEKCSNNIKNWLKQLKEEGKGSGKDGKEKGGASGKEIEGKGREKDGKTGEIDEKGGEIDGKGVEKMEKDGKGGEIDGKGVENMEKDGKGERGNSKKRILFILSSAYEDFATVTLNFILGENWKNYFDFGIFLAEKPSFFYENRPFFHLVKKDDKLEEVMVHDLAGDNEFHGGNLLELKDHIMIITGKRDPKILFFGDSLRSDIIPSKRFGSWDTVFICEEMACENCFYKHRENNLSIENVNTKDTSLMPWGSIFTDEDEGGKIQKTMVSHSIQKYADLSIPNLQFIIDKPLDYKFECFEPRSSLSLSGFHPLIPDAFKN